MKHLRSWLFKSNEIDLHRHSNNFDFLRLFAAALVLIGHAPYILNGHYLPWDPFRDLYNINMERLGVLMFFVISGFLVSHSWENKSDYVDFFLARVLRIYPLAIVVVFISVFVVGPMLTTATTSEYFNSTATGQYIQNATIFRIYYYLPGVFEQNPTSSINGSIWTLPYEFTCYIFLGIFGVMQLFKKKILTLILFTTLVLSGYFFTEEIKKIIIPILGIDFKTFYPLFLYFMAGSVFYQLKDIIKLNLVGLFGAAITLWLCKESSWYYYISLLALPYIILTIAFFKSLPLQNISKYGDVSYGLYLFAFPVQQLIVTVFQNSISLATMILLSFACTIPCAFLSWHCIENPSLQIRGTYKKLKTVLAESMVRFINK